jgi:HEPN domain-containing protein
MNAPKSEPKEWVIARRWLAHADRDLAVAELLVTQAEPLLSAAAFHCQQAAEKMGKALLIVFRTPVPKVHDLESLAELLSAPDPESAARMFELADLTTWYINSRYPGQSDDVPSRGDIIASLSKLQALRRHIDTLAPRS